MPLPKCILHLLPDDLVEARLSSRWAVNSVSLTPAVRNSGNTTAICDTDGRIDTPGPEPGQTIEYDCDALHDALSLLMRMGAERVTVIPLISVDGSPAPLLTIVNNTIGVAAVIAPIISPEPDAEEGS